MGVSLRDVAARAGVSVKTVSNVVNDYPHVRPETRQRVQEALDALNYRPNLSARTLRRGRSGAIALALPELDIPYFAELARFVVKAAEKRNWTVLIEQTDGIRERELNVLQGDRQHLVDGLILSPVALTAQDLAAHSDEVPLVLLGERIFGGSADHVAIDNVGALRSATEHLLGLGRQRVAAIGDQTGSAGTSGVASLRMRGYTAALEAAGLALDPSLVAAVESYRRADGAKAMRALLDRPDPPDGVVCFNDLLALGALRALYEAGSRVPDDVAVIGVDDIEDGRFAVPSLSTISPDKAVLAASAVRLLGQRIAGDSAEPPQEVAIDHALIARESTVGRA